MPTPVPLPTAVEVQAAVTRVLEQPEFKSPPPAAWAKLRDWLWESVREWWEAFRHLLELDPESVRRTGETLLWVAAAIAVAVLVLAVARALRGRRRAEGALAPVTVVETPGSERSLEEQLATAAAAARSGAFVAAARALYLAVVLWLERGGHVRYAAAKTGSEYAAEMPAGVLRRAFGGLLRAFYPVAYGGRPDAPGAYARMRALASELGVPEP